MPAALYKDFIQWTVWQLIGYVADMQVNQRAFDVLVAHQLLHRQDVHPILQKVGGKGVAQQVGMDILKDACLLG